MQGYATIAALGVVGGVLFFFALGAVCGSFINVLVYRLPRGLSIVSPPSACPACGTMLTWRQNFPIFGWLLLRGRCRYCRSRISAEYPIVELFVALLFALVFLWFADPFIMAKIGIDIRAWRPGWAGEGLARMWPMALIVLCLFGSLVAATLIDARTFMIPIALPWFATGVAFVVHPLHAVWFQSQRGAGGGQVGGMGWGEWTIPLPTGATLGAALGGGAGLGVSLGLLALGWIPRSFADYEEWEKSRPEPASGAEMGPVEAESERRAPEATNLRLVLRRALFLTGPAIALMFGGFSVGLRYDYPLQATAIGTGVGLLIGLALRRMAGDAGGDEPHFLNYPHGRREMGKEILFLLPILLLAGLGVWLIRPTGAAGWLADLGSAPPFWLQALAGSMFGYLIAGGAVWITRIGGTLVLGREAMGMGDVHLLAAAGAALGWIDPLLAFFTAPFFGIAWALFGSTFGRLLKISGSALPYGPHLAAATALVVLAKPLFESLLSWILGEPINIP